MSFRYRELLPGVFHIEDALGVCMTLLVGSERALLVDAGFGLEDVAAFVGTLTDRPVRLVLTHGHYDHILGAGYFPEAALGKADTALAHAHSGVFWRQRALDEADRQGLLTDRRAFLSRPEPLWKNLEERRIELGGLSVQVIPCPGHTPGSVVFYVPERALLLTGDDWNPCTCLFSRRLCRCRITAKTCRSCWSCLFSMFSVRTGPICTKERCRSASLRD